MADTTPTTPPENQGEPTKRKSALKWVARMMAGATLREAAIRTIEWLWNLLGL